MEICHSRDRPLSLPFPVCWEQTFHHRQAYVLLHKLNFPSERLRIKSAEWLNSNERNLKSNNIQFHNIYVYDVFYLQFSH